ncbi:hypothetical protein FHS16_005767 [Paenibacillus endophyticus]|uniref:Uncharacterized protein n=1 Tax=Paenibacillus endophyticus TaxID=1294268 RepID=A0A7W5CEY9_9BACL|nr:hypothetical protein [Paenibacillus endophyticus]
MENFVVTQAERIAGQFLLEQVKTSYQIIGKGFVNQACVVETESRNKTFLSYYGGDIIHLI